MSWLSKVFELSPAGANWPRAVLFLDVALVPLVTFWAIGHEEYLLSRAVRVVGRPWRRLPASRVVPRRPSPSSC
jgi:hypothetical protein